MYNFYNVTADKTDEWQALEKIKKEAYEAGRQAGFAAGYAAAQGQPQAKIDAAYEQGIRDAAKLQPVRKNGCGY